MIMAASTSVNSWWLLIVSQAQLQGELFCWKCWHWDCTWTNVDPQNLQCHSFNSVPRTVWSGKYCIARIQIRSTQGQTALGVPALRQGQFRHNWHPRNDQGAVDTLMDVFTCVKFWSCFRCLRHYTRQWRSRSQTWSFEMFPGVCDNIRDGGLGPSHGSGESACKHQGCWSEMQTCCFFFTKKLWDQVFARLPKIAEYLWKIGCWPRWRHNGRGVHPGCIFQLKIQNIHVTWLQPGWFI